MPPSRRLLEALATTRAGGGQVVLVLPDEVDARIRQTVLAVPEDADEQAFMHAAWLIRRAFDLSGGSE